MSRPRSSPDGYDVAVVGAGPAGLAAAVSAAENGARVVLVDAAAQLGGQYWRHPDERYPRGDEAPDGKVKGHHDWRTFADLRARLRRLRAAGQIVHLACTQVWFVEPVGTRWVLDLTPAPGTEAAAGPESVFARSLILCPGGYDRQLPVPGWDLPGVMAAGGVQALLKAHRTVPGRRAVVAGTGPFLLPVATQLAVAGVEVVAVCEAGSLGPWLRQPGAMAAAPGKLVEGAGYAASFLRHRIPYLTRTVVTAVEADASGDRAGSVRLRRLDRTGAAGGPERTLEADLVAFGWGFTPSLELVTAVGADTRLDVDRSLVAVVDDLQRSSREGVLVAGEATGVGGAGLATAEGELAGLVAAAGEQAGRDATGLRRRTARLRRRIARLRRFAVAMHTAHPVPEHWSGWLRGDTTICRCEEVDLATIERATQTLGATDARTVKLLARPGMGWCQGRVCGFSVACLAARSDGRALEAGDLRPFAKRTLITPVPLGQLAALGRLTAGVDGSEDGLQEGGAT